MFEGPGKNLSTPRDSEREPRTKETQLRGKVRVSLSTSKNGDL
jgi:hypothetical protein